MINYDELIFDPSPSVRLTAVIYSPDIKTIRNAYVDPDPVVRSLSYCRGLLLRDTNVERLINDDVYFHNKLTIFKLDILQSFEYSIPESSPLLLRGNFEAGFKILDYNITRSNYRIKFPSTNESVRIDEIGAERVAQLLSEAEEIYFNLSMRNERRLDVMRIGEYM